MAGNRNVFEIILQLQKKGHGAKDAEKELSGMEKSVKGAASALGGIAIAAGIAAGAIIAAKKAFDFAAEGAQIQRLETAFNTLAKSMNQDAYAIKQAISDASNGTIDDLTAMGIANRALILGVAKTPEQFKKLTSAATALGQAMGESASQAVDDLTTGIGRMSPLILDNLGIVGASINAYPQYAASIGVAVSALTDAQKKQALLNFALEKAKPLLDENGNVLADNASAFERFGAQSADAGLRFKKNFADLIAPVVSDMADMLEGINTISSAMELLGAKSINYAGRQFYELASGIRVTRQELLDMAAAAVRAGKNVEGVEFHGLTHSLEAAGAAAEGVSSSLDQVTKSSVAAGLVGELNKKLSNGTIDQTAYEEGLRQINAVFGIIPAAALNASIGISHITNELANGNVTLKEAIRLGKQWLIIQDSLGSGGVGVSTPGSGVNAGTGRPGRSGAQEGFQHGGSMIVPPGYPNDSYRIGVSSGEHVKVEPVTNNTVNSGGNINVNVSNKVDEQVLISQLSKFARRA